MVNIKCLKDFKNISDFLKFTEKILDLQWKIEKQLLKQRVEKYRKYELFKELQSEFIEKQLSIFDLKSEEVITWFDTSLILRRILLKLYERAVNTNNISIIMEYPVVFGNHMRSDFLIIVDRLIIVLEFGMFNQAERRSEERYTKKLQESISYRQIIANMVPKEVKVINYVMIYKPEYDDSSKVNLTEKIKYNKLEVEKTASFLEFHIKQELTYSARYQLEKLGHFNKI